MYKKYVHYLLALLAYLRYGRPSRRLIVVGVTGTKGKSTTCRLIASVLEAGGYKVGLLSTVEFQVGEKRWLNDKKMTMLGRGQIQGMLRDMVRAGCQYAVVETSSEGILQYRHFGLNYDIAVFTNLGTEHSERHGGFENLRRDKAKMFKALQSPRKTLFGRPIKKVSVVNEDDANAPFYASLPADEKWGVSLEKKNLAHVNHHVTGHITDHFSHGTGFTANDKKYELLILGDFNVQNALSAIAVGLSQGIEPEAIRKGLANVTMVPGRMEFVDEKQSFKVLVDYAHEPLSLEALFTAMRQMTSVGGKVIGVIGSDGGGRDVTKRPKMGAIAGRLCDLVVVTDVNPFDDDPEEIIEMLAKGAREAGKKDGVDLFLEVDRRAGIKKAFALAGPGDVVAITAKGTEPCIVVAGGKRIPWDDRTVAREELRALR
jgi:UDP-N-acetylmuramoyl-L-alanyl-D-glutamate--2,6-diaminopimelate ligase